MRVTVFLQNAWSPLYAGGTWPRESWLKALHRSRSGQRIRVLVEAAIGHEWWFDNTTPLVGAMPSSIIEADEKHILRVIEESTPDIVITMGKQAAAAVVPLFGSSMICLPHPAYRVVTNELFVEAGKFIVPNLEGPVELSQGRGKVLLNGGRLKVDA